MYIATAIPYRSDAALSAPALGEVALWTVLILALLTGLFLLARKRGWGKRWQGALAVPVANGKTVTRQGTHRLSRSAVMHFVSIDGESMVIVESRGGVCIQRLTPASKEG